MTGVGISSLRVSVIEGMDRWKAWIGVGDATRSGEQDPVSLDKRVTVRLGVAVFPGSQSNPTRGEFGRG